MRQPRIKCVPNHSPVPLLLAEAVQVAAARRQFRVHLFVQLVRLALQMALPRRLVHSLAVERDRTPAPIVVRLASEVLVQQNAAVVAILCRFRVEDQPENETQFEQVHVGRVSLGECL